jgi:hypothetical protein
MNRITVFVGLDYHLHTVQVCILNRAGKVLGNRRCENDRLMIVTYVEQFGTDIRVAIESCVGASDFAEELVQQHGWSVDLAHPGYVHRMKQSPDKEEWDWSEPFDNDEALIEGVGEITFPKRDREGRRYRSFIGTYR